MVLPPTCGVSYTAHSGGGCRLRIHLSAPCAHDEIRGHRLPFDVPQSHDRDRLTTSQKLARGSVVQECKGSHA